MLQKRLCKALHKRFWKSVLGEFWQRTQFDSFEQAVERTAPWVKYYNHVPIPKRELLG
jgi:hypothetical protein